MNVFAGEGQSRWSRRRGLGLLGGVAAVAALATLAVGPAGAQTTSSTSTSSTSSTSSSTTSTTTNSSTTVPTAVTQTASVQFICLGSTPTDQATLNTAGAASAGAIPQGTDGNYYIVSTFAVTSSVPKFLENGQTFPVSFSAQLDVTSLASSTVAGLSVAISGDPTFLISGGGSGGPFVGAPTGGTVTPPSVTTIPPSVASGTVTGVDKSQPIIYSMQDPLHSSIAISISGAPVFSWNMTCHTTAPDVAATNGSLPPEPSTTLPPTVAPVAQAANTTANFTG